MEDKKDLARILMNRAPEPTKMLKSPESIEYAERGGNFQYASDRANRIMDFVLRLGRSLGKKRWTICTTAVGDERGSAANNR